MTRKYKVVKNAPLVPEEEVSQLSDFDGVLSRAKGGRQPFVGGKYRLAILFSSLVLISAGVWIYLFEDEERLVKNEAPPIVQKTYDGEAVVEGPVNKPEISTQKTQEEFPIQPKGVAEVDESFSEPVELSSKLLKVSEGKKDLEWDSEQSKELVELSQESTVAYEETVAEPLVGYDSLYRYFAAAIAYPKELLEEQVAGEVLLEFEISEDGKPTKIKVLKSVHRLLDEEAERVVRQMPVWKPATVYGESVPSKMTIPIMFQSN